MFSSETPRLHQVSKLLQGQALIQPEDQPTANLAPDLRMSQERLNPDWILDWLKKPSDILPGTRMPAFWPDYPKSSYPASQRRRRSADSRDPRSPDDVPRRPEPEAERREDGEQ